MNPQLIAELREIARALERHHGLGCPPDLADARRLRGIADQLEAAAPPQQLITLSRNLARRILDTNAGRLRPVFDRPERIEVDAIPIGNLLAVQTAAEYVHQMTGHLLWPEDVPEPGSYDPNLRPGEVRVTSEHGHRDVRNDGENCFAHPGITWCEACKAVYGTARWESGCHPSPPRPSHHPLPA